VRVLDFSENSVWYLGGVQQPHPVAYIVLEYMNKGDLIDVVRSTRTVNNRTGFDEEMCRFYFR